MQDTEGGTRVALVTGTSRGLGMAMARQLAMRGWDVVATARTEGGLAELDDLLRTQGRQATLAPLDLADAEGLQRLGQEIAKRWGRLDMLAHMAAEAAPASPVVHIDEKILRRTLEGNVLAAQRVIAMADPLLRESPKSLAVFALDAAYGAYRGAYRAAKAGVKALAQSYFLENRRGPVRVAAIQPPPMATALRARSHPGEDPDALTQPDVAAEGFVEAILDREDSLEGRESMKVYKWKEVRSRGTG